jgi:hypothetical protein
LVSDHQVWLFSVCLGSLLHLLCLLVLLIDVRSIFFCSLSCLCGSYSYQARNGSASNCSFVSESREFEASLPRYPIMCILPNLVCMLFHQQAYPYLLGIESLCCCMLLHLLLVQFHFFARGKLIYINSVVINGKCIC